MVWKLLYESETKYSKDESLARQMQYPSGINTKTYFVLITCKWSSISMFAVENDDINTIISSISISISIIIIN